MEHYSLKDAQSQLEKLLDDARQGKEILIFNEDISLSSTAKKLIENPENIIYLSVASSWEMAIKVSLGKLKIPSPFTEFIDEQMHLNTIILLNVKTAHVGLVATPPFHHRDPFDRLIIAQSQSEGIPIIGKDRIFKNYEITCYW